MTGIILHHGWGIESSSFWKPLRSILQEEYGYVCHEIIRGYFSEPRSPHAALMNEGICWYGIGHSFGLLKLFECLPRLSGYVSISGFLDLLSPDAEAAGRRIRRMEQRLSASGVHCVLDDFYQACGFQLPPPSHIADPDLLLGDLRSIRLCTRKEPIQGPFLALHGKNDIIVPEDTARCSFPHIIWHESGTHSLGFHHAVWCAYHIQSFISSNTYSEARYS